MAREQRKTVTVLFCDLAGSTALGESVDPERLRTLLAAYFERMKGIVEHHGGSVEKFIGDAVMAVFGVPSVHEDDALRAVRAAVEMRDALPELGLEGRIGVTTGEVATGTEERLATGDAVNVAARLEQAAQPGEVLIGEPTLHLVRGAVETQSIEPLELKGKSEPVPAHRLVRVSDAPARRHEAGFVGRDRELTVLSDAWDRVQAQAGCELVTVVGEAGVGKSRLAHEFVAGVRSRVVSGRCLPYGEGITYWPVVEVLKQLDVLPPEETAAAAIRTLLGESDAASSAEEIAWAFRKTLEHAAAEQPLVVVFDDTQWGEETFRDLIEHVALLSSGAAILLLCIARPELSEQHPTWPVTLRLEPLQDHDVEALIPETIAGPLRKRIARTSGGNPLFIGEMLAMTGEVDGDVVVPPTLQALLAARLDQLEPAERNVLERGAIEGEIFHRGAVQALAPDEPQVTPRLAALVRKELIRPDRPQLAGDDGFRFRHILIRDAAYDALPKAVRADLHARFAAWLERNGASLIELNEIVGYHLGQALLYRAELGLPEDDELAAAARRHLTAGGHRAALRQDYGAAASLYERAAALVPPGELDLALETELGDALLWAGRGDVALQRMDAVAERAALVGDVVGELCGKIKGSVLRLALQPQGAKERLAALLEEALPAIEATRDDLARYIAYTAASDLEWEYGRMDTSVEAWEIALEHAEHAGIQPTTALAGRAAGRFFGTTPVPELLKWIDDNEPRGGRDHFLRAYRAGSLAMLGRFDEARAILSEDRADQAERGGGILLANLTAFESVWVELWAGDAAAAADFAAEGWRLHLELGESSFLPNAAASLAEAFYALDRLDEADAWAVRAAEMSIGDPWHDMLWRRVRAKVFARRSEHAEAERLAYEAVAICNETQMLDKQGDTYADLAEVLELSGKTVEAVTALEQALERYERKGNLVSEQRVRDRLAELDAAAQR